MTTIFTVGTGGTHATPQAAYDAIPEPLDDRYVIRLKNQEFVSTGSAILLNVTARTTTAGFDIIIEPEPGAGFKDHPNVRAGPLRYDASKGAAIRSENAPTINFAGVVNHITIRGIQVKQQSSVLSSLDVIKSAVGNDSTNRVFKDLVVELSGQSDNNDVFALNGINKIINCVVIHRDANPTSGIKLVDTAAGQSLEAIGCTVVRPGNLTSGGVGLFNAFNGNTFTAENCAIFGFAADAQDLDSPSDYNATSFSDAASGLPDPATDHNVYSMTYADQFEQSSDSGGNHDFRAKSGSGLENAGLLNAANSPADISGFTRNDPPEIGAWELGGLLQPRKYMHPTTSETALDLAKITTSPFKSDLLGLNNAARITLMAQFSAAPSAGQWVIRAIPTGGDNTVPGQIIATLNFPVTDRVASVTVEVAHGVAYVQQATPVAGATLEKMSLFRQQ